MHRGEITYMNLLLAKGRIVYIIKGICTGNLITLPKELLTVKTAKRVAFRIIPKIN
jgi:hypothetical protein